MIGTAVGAARVTKLPTPSAGSRARRCRPRRCRGCRQPGPYALESDLAYHLIDLTLGGDPVLAPEPVARPFTAVDMALCRLHLDAILAPSPTPSAPTGRPLTKGLAIRDLRQNLAQLRLAPELLDVLVFGMDVTSAKPATTAASSWSCRCRPST